MAAQNRTKEEWKKIIEDFESSKQKRRDFCKTINLNAKTFKNRYYQLRGDKGNDSNKAGFIKFKILQPSTSGIRVHLPNGINIEVAGQDALKLIKELMNVA